MKKNFILICTIICTLSFSLCLTSCEIPKFETETDIIYPYDGDEETQQEWIKKKIRYLEKTHGQKVIEVKEDLDWVTFIFETEYMSPKPQITEMKYLKN